MAIAVSVTLIYFVILGTELILRKRTGRKVISLAPYPTKFENNTSIAQGSWLLSPHEMRIRDPSFSKSHWIELEAWNNLQGRTERWKPDGEGPYIRRWAIEFGGSLLSVRNRERTTIGQPETFTNQIFCFGGSLTFAMEVSDHQTWPSVLQRKIVECKSLQSYRVRNLGIPARPGLEMLDSFYYLESLTQGDVVIFMFGDNDCGWRTHGVSGSSVHDEIPFLLRQFLRRIASRSEVAGVIYGLISPSFLRRIASQVVDRTIAEARAVKAYAEARGAKVLLVLEPNIFSLQQPEEWERRLISCTARDLRILLTSGYKKYLKWISQSDFAVSAANIFDAVKPSPYMGDWAHVNSRGNQLIGEFVFEELVTRRIVW